MKLGSLCSGAGGLDLAVEQVFGAETVWHAETDEAASKVLAHRWPGVPNLGDLTQIDWDTVEPVDVMCGGFPCQPFSVAGQRKGLKDERAIWPHIARAVGVVRPRYVVLENVVPLLASGEFQRVASSLAALGYDLRWACLRASDVGAPHRRERLFVVAHTAGEFGTAVAAGDDSTTLDHTGFGAVIRDHAGYSAARVRQLGRSTGNGRAAADTACDGWDERRPQPERIVGGFDASVGGAGPVELLPTPMAQQSGNSPEAHLRKKPGRHQVTDLAIVVENGLLETSGLLPTPRTSDSNGSGGHGDGGPDLRTLITDLLPTPSAADGAGGHTNRSGDRKDELLLPGIAKENAWGKYAAAVRRWEQSTRPAPPPTKSNRNNKPRLNPAFSEWMMGWPEGWVTAVPGVSRSNQLRIIGNGVVPQQAVAALHHLIGVAV